MTKHIVLQGLPKNWLQRQCSECRMIIALPLDDLSRGNPQDLLREEMEGHLLRTHVDLPSNA
jgi:hypothetical protein